MAKAGVGAKPKLSFREQGEDKPESSTAGIHAEKQVRESLFTVQEPITRTGPTSFALGMYRRFSI